MIANIASINEELKKTNKHTKSRNEAKNNQSISNRIYKILIYRPAYTYTKTFR